MIKIENISYGYKSNHPIFNDISLEIGNGIYGLLGENGVGKTTLIHLLCGLLFPWKGECSIDGMNPAKREPALLSRYFFLPEEMQMPSESISAFATRHSAFYPHFNHKEFEQSPTNGLDITSRQALKRIISRSIDDDSTLLISTHQAHDFENLLDHLIILGEGEILLNRSLDEISQRLLFARTDSLPEDSIYSEQELPGYFSVLPNEEEEENTPDIELLYKAMLQVPEKIKSMFK